MKRLSLRYRESEEFHRSILEATPHGIVETAVDGTVTFCNEELLSIVGAERAEQIMGKNVLDFIIPERREKARELMREALVRGSMKNLDYTALRLDGSTGEQELSIAVRYSTGNSHPSPAGFIGVVRDVSEERKNYRESVRFRYLLDQVNDAILIHSVEEGKIVDVNEAALRMGGYSREELLRKSVLDLDVGTGPQEQEELKREVLDYGMTTFETVNLLKDGSKAYTEIKLSKIEMLREPYLVSVIRDVTRIKRAEREVKSLLQEKEQLLKEVHHRIKNHMGTISSILSLNEDYYDDERISGVLGDIHNKIRVMQNIYQSLYIGEDVSSVCLSSFINPLIRDLEYAYVVGSGITFQRDIEDLELSAKQSLPLGIIVNELVTNALKYSFPGRTRGTIRVSIRRDEESTDVLRIAVTDDGVGIPEEIIREEDYGFGLTLVKGYAQQFDGGVSLHNEEGAAVEVFLLLEERGQR
jgi:PAS domain S-box-containing protein